MPAVREHCRIVRSDERRSRPIADQGQLQVVHDRHRPGVKEHRTLHRLKHRRLPIERFTFRKNPRYASEGRADLARADGSGLCPEMLEENEPSEHNAIKSR
ncbi:hypothetical protein D3C80_1845350 [compost metagenome]